MREIEFRGKTLYDHYDHYASPEPDIKGGTWVYGGLMTEYPYHKGLTIVENGVCHEVDPETVGQYTGLKDKLDNKIFQHDLPGGTWLALTIDKCPKCASFQMFTPQGECLACLQDVKWEDFVSDVHKGEVEIAGNVHDNPELMVKCPAECICQTCAKDPTKCEYSDCQWCNRKSVPQFCRHKEDEYE